MIEEKKVEESVTVHVEEDAKKIEEIDLLLNTSQSGIASYVTDDITGFIEAMIIDSDSRVQIDISLQKFPDIKLFSTADFYGQEYISLRSIAISNEYEKFNFVGNKFCLNDKLKIVVSGPLNTNTRFLIRYTKAV